jgi:hypothetical protein
MEVVVKSKRLLDPLDRSGEILFGLIMALTFTCSISVANARSIEINQLLIAAISCNLTWGIIDSMMFLIGVLAQRNRNKVIFNFVHNSSESVRAREFISASLPPIIASVLEKEELEKIRMKLINLPGETGKKKLTPDDLKKAAGLFILVFISTFPVVIPFIFIKDTMLALRISNLIAIVMMFLCGWSVASFVGINKWIMSTTMVIVGVALVTIAIVLGG